MAQMVKNPPAIQETWVQYLGWEDPLEEVMTTHSSILAWSIPWTKEPGRLQFMGVANSQTQLSTAHSFILDDLAHFQNNVLIIPVILLF